jgi:hypothetical protein
MEENRRMTPTTRARPDAVCAAAVDTARDALLAVVGSDDIGAYAGHDAEGERLVTHYFASTRRGYLSWRWSVTVTRASRHKSVTVDEIVLLPGPDAVLAPRWVPWRERVQPGDIGPGFLLPTEADDPRLAPGYTAADEAPDDEAVRSVVDELGLGRERVLSPVGRDEAAERWYTGSHGPQAPIAQSALDRCSTCGFVVKLTGGLGSIFGVCTNEFSPSDGRVVSFDHGCGAHSQVSVPGAQGADLRLPEPVLDTLGYDDVERF